MLPPFIIEQIRQREEEPKHREEQPVLELPLPVREKRSRQTDDEPGRGIVVIDLFG